MKPAMNYVISVAAPLWDGTDVRATIYQTAFIRDLDDVVSHLVDGRSFDWWGCEYKWIDPHTVLVVGKISGEVLLCLSVGGPITDATLTQVAKEFSRLENFITECNEAFTI